MIDAYGENVQPDLWPSRWIAIALDQIQIITHIDGFRPEKKSCSIFRIKETRWFIFDYCCSTVERTWTTWPCFSNTNYELWTWFWIFNYKRCEISQPDTAITLRMGRWTQPWINLNQRRETHMSVLSANTMVFNEIMLQLFESWKSRRGSCRRMNLYEEQQPRAIVPLLFDRVQLFLLSTGLAFTFMVLMIPFLLNYLDGSFYQLLKMSRGIILWTCMFPIGYCVMLATEYTIDKANANHRFTVGLLCIGVAEFLQSFLQGLLCNLET